MPVLQSVQGRQQPSSQKPDQVTVVIYYMCDEPIPYCTRVHSATVTLCHFKDLIVKKGNFRFDHSLIYALHCVFSQCSVPELHQDTRRELFGRFWRDQMTLLLSSQLWA